MKPTTFLIFIPFLLFNKVNAKEIHPKRVTIADFSKQNNANENGIIFYNDCHVSFIGNNSGWFSVKYIYDKCFLISNRMVLDEANLSFVLYNNLVDKDNFKIDASTFNLVNGNIVETELTKDQKFKEKINRSFRTIKCQMPNVKEGSIIQYHVEIISPFYQYISPFTFQSSLFPTLSSTYSISIPEMFDYVNLTRGAVTFDTTFTSKRTEFFNIRNINDMHNGAGLTELSTTIYRETGIMRNLPALKADNLVYSTINILPSTRYQLSRIFLKGHSDKMVLQDWKKIYMLLHDDDYFGKELKNKISWKKPHDITSNASSNLKKASQVYDYVKFNISYNNEQEYIPSQKLNDVLKNKSGSCADINLLLVSMLRSVDILAYPALVSTRDKGYPISNYPFMNDFNYLIAVVEIDSQFYFLDATDPDLSFGLLPEACYNGNIMSYHEPGEIMQKINLDPELLDDRKSIIHHLQIDSNLKMIGAYDAKYGPYAGYKLRHQLHTTDYQQKFTENLYKKVNYKVVSDSIKFENLDSCDYQLEYHFRYHTELKAANKLIYLNPCWIDEMFSAAFNDATRTVGMEFPSQIHYAHQTIIDLPKNVTIEEIPENHFVSILDDAGILETTFINLENRLQINYVLTLSITSISNEKYIDVKDLFTSFNKNNNPTIILKLHE